MPSQTDSGKGFEYALALESASLFDAEICGEAQTAALNAYNSLTQNERTERDLAARAALQFISRRERRLATGNVAEILMQPDSVARAGDVRDLVIKTRQGEEIGFSAKNRSRTIRNPRISPTNCFGKNWYAVRHSKPYLKAIQKVWDYLAPMADENQRWPERDEKRNNIYLPTLSAFINETRHILAEDAQSRVRKMMSYMLGVADYYMIYKQNGDVAIQSFNMNRTLSWGNSMPMPTRLIEIDMRPNSWTTAIMVLDSGWQLSFRIHTADRLVKTSLKFDVRILGQPTSFSQHFIEYH